MNRESRRKLALEKLDELEVLYGNIVNIPDNELIAVRLMLDAEWSPKSIEKTSIIDNFILFFLHIYVVGKGTTSKFSSLTSSSSLFFGKISADT